LDIPGGIDGAVMGSDTIRKYDIYNVSVCPYAFDGCFGLH